MSDQAIAERVDLAKKDKSELQAIVTALGGKSNSRMKKAELIDIILELSGVTSSAATPADPERADRTEPEAVAAGDTTAEPTDGTGDRRSGDGTADTASDRSSAGTSAPDTEGGTRVASGPRPEEASPAKAEGSGGGGRRRRGKRPTDEPPSEWETELEDPASGGQRRRSQQNGKQKQNQNQKQNDKQNQQTSQQQSDRQKQQPSQQQSDRQNQKQNDKQNQQPSQQQSDKQNQQRNADNGDESESGNKRRRRRGRGRERDDNIEPASQEPIAVSGHLDLRDDGYGFLRVSGLLPSQDDVYVPVKMARQFGLRKGDLVTGTARPASRNEKNPALQQLDTINGASPETIAGRPHFDDLTPLFPDERLRLERARQPLDLTARIIDLIAPIGKGQRGLIVSPPKAGKTTIMKEIATSIEQNHPEVQLIVLLVDERPEEVTDMRRHLERGEVVASTFDRPTEEHCAVAELTIERAKRMVEEGKDVVVVLDGITRLARAYNMSATGTGRVMSGGVDAGALYPPKKFLGAARNLEEGGSLTILATALVETGSRMDEVIFEEFKGTGNMELRLDRSLAERYIFPALDALGSSTRRDELLMDGKEHHSSLKLRKVLAGMSAGQDGSAAAAMNLLMDRLKSFKTNEEFLTEIAKAP